MVHLPIAMDNYKPRNNMISNQRELYNLIDSVLKPFKFIKKKETWYRHTDDCICYFTCGKSPYGGGEYGHAMGCFLKEIYEGKDEFPKYYKDNLRYSLSDMANKDVVEKVFNLEGRNFVNNERELIITDLITNHAVPFLNDVSTKEGIINAVDKYKGLKNRMDLKIKKALSIED